MVSLSFCGLFNLENIFSAVSETYHKILYFPTSVSVAKNYYFKIQTL